MGDVFPKTSTAVKNWLMAAREVSSRNANMLFDIVNDQAPALTGGIILGLMNGFVGYALDPSVALDFFVVGLTLGATVTAYSKSKSSIKDHLNGNGLLLVGGFIAAVLETVQPIIPSTPLALIPALAGGFFLKIMTDTYFHAGPCAGGV